MLQSNNNKAMSLAVTDELSVAVIPDPYYEFLIPTKDVARGYGATEWAIQRAKTRNTSDLVEGKHFVSARTICPSDPTTPHNKVFWTKRGIIRLGFFIKSERARLFRDWAEELVLGAVAAPSASSKAGVPQRVNGLDKDRMIRLLALTSEVREPRLRSAFTNELMGGHHYGK